MSATLDFIKRHAVLTYFALTFAISWGGALLVVGPGGIPGTREQVEALLPFVVLALLAGPSVTGLLLTGIVEGRAGFRELRSRLLRWRVGGRWCAAALLTAPVLMLSILLVLSRFSREFLPGISVSEDKAALLRFGIAVGLGAGVFEELGWTGYAVPRLRLRHGVLATGLLVGFPWAVWHLLPAVWLSGTVSGDLSLTSYLLDPFLFLVAFRVLLVWVYDRTGSLLLAMLMHVSLTATTRILGPPAIAGVSLMTFDLVWALLLWTLIAALAAANRGRLSRQALRAGAA